MSQPTRPLIEILKDALTALELSDMPTFVPDNALISEMHDAVVQAGLRPKQPMDKDYLREMCKAVEARLPDNHGFIVFAFPFDGGRMFYTSNAPRADAVHALKTWLIQASGSEEWLQHIK